MDLAGTIHFGCSGWVIMWALVSVEIHTMPFRAICLILTLGAAMANAKEDPLAGSLLDVSPSGIRSAAHALRRSHDLNDPEHLYSYVHSSRMLIQYALVQAEGDPNGDEYRKSIIPVTYNLAADTWTGWEDANSAAEDHRALGFEAAKLNVELRESLGQAGTKLGIGYWILGAHLITDNRFSEALVSFSKCRDLADEDGNEVSAAMAQGWIHVANILSGKDESRELGATKERLTELGKDGRFYASQFDPAISNVRGN
jgi:hypothetical protein